MERKELRLFILESNQDPAREAESHFGHHRGLNADWNTKAWHLRDDGDREYWLLDGEDGYWAIVTRFWDEEEGTTDIKDVMSDRDPHKVIQKAIQIKHGSH